MINIPEKYQLDTTECEQRELLEFRVCWMPHNHFWFGLVVGFTTATILFVLFICVFIL